jgi:hypothetical protein
MAKYHPKMARERSNAGIAKRKKILLEKLEEELGAKVIACKSAGISISTFYNYYDSDPEFAEKVDTIVEGIGQKVEQSLIKKAIEDKDTLAQIFFLKTQRGWKEKKEIEVTGKTELIQVLPAWEEAKIIPEETETSSE